MLNCENARIIMMDRLFGESSSSNKAQLDIHLKTCLHCQQEWEDVQAAHAIYSANNALDVPAAVECVSALEPFSAPDNPVRSYAQYYAAAASFTLLFAVSYFSLSYFTNPAWSPENKTISHAESTAPNLNEIERNASPGTFDKPSPELKQPSAFFAMATKDKIRKSDEETRFRAGMLIYNRAFSKIGESRDILLQEAIDILTEIASRNDETIQWAAMAKILVADAYQHIGQSAKAIATYQSMIDQFPEILPYKQEAQISMINLMLQDESELNNAVSILKDLFSTKPITQEPYQAAFAIAGKYREQKPEETLYWCQAILKGLSETNPIAQQARQLSDDVERKLLDKELVQDWWILAPLLESPLMQEIPGLEKGNFGGLNPNFVASKTGGVKGWQRPYPDGAGEVVLSQWQQEKDWSAISATYAYSENEQEVSIQFKAQNGFRVWINQEPIWGRGNGLQYGDHWYTLRWHLKKGWNSIWVKTYHTADDVEAKFAFRILDGEKHILPGLHFNPNQKND